MTDRRLIVTIDGPSGAGKSTISRRLAATLGYTFLDTGAMYRAVGLKAREQGLDLDTAAGLAGLEEMLAATEVTLHPAEGLGEETRVFLDGREVSREIRAAEMGLVASRVSALAPVRARLTEMQRRLAGGGGVVAEGRDTGTVVFPAAECKFYLDAAPEERARRRCQQLRDQGREAEFAAILAQIVQRDADDSSRALAPLRPAEDAVIVDSSRLSEDEVVAAMLATIRARQAGD